MSPSSPDHVVLTDQQRHDLQRLTRAGRTQQRLALRARIVLHAADGHNNTGIATDLGVYADTVRKWRNRWCRNLTVATLAHAARSGRPPRFTRVLVAGVTALACTHPADHAPPLSRWSCPDLAHQAVAVKICPGISSPTVRRWLAQDRSSPGSFRRGSSSPIPTSRPRPNGSWTCTPTAGTDSPWAAATPSSVPTRRPRSRLVVGATRRCRRALPGSSRVTNDDHRRGAVAYLAAYDVHRGRVHGRCEDTTGIDRFMRLVQQVMSQEPYTSVDRVFWVVDNGPRTAGRPAHPGLPERRRGAHPGAHRIA